MEDLDHPKVKPGAAAQALDDLRWMGLDWDEGPDLGGPCAPYVQSQCMPFYCAALDQLCAQGRVYPCICSRRDVETGQSAPHAGEEGPRYPGTCRDRFSSYEEATAALPDGRLPAWRFRVPDEAVVFEDGFGGRVAANVAERDGDFVIARHRDGAGYMLAVVIDDARMGISEVLRGDDLQPATHRQLLLYRALGLPPPAFTHVPLVVSPEGRRLAKRHGDTRITALREQGVAPETVTGLLAHWCGWAGFGEQISAPALIRHFDLAAVPRQPVVLTGAVKSLLGIAD